MPFLIALPYLGARALRRLALGIWVVALAVAVVAAYSAMETPAAIPVEAVVLGLVDTSLTTALVLYLLWGYRERLTRVEP